MQLSLLIRKGICAAMRSDPSPHRRGEDRRMQDDDAMPLSNSARQTRFLGIVIGSANVKEDEHSS